MDNLIFLPNKFEREVSILRNTIHNLILKNGITPRYIYMLSKIYKAEALNSNETIPTNLTEFTNKIFSAVYIKKKEKGEDFKFSTEDIGKCIINQKLYLSLILLLSKQTNKITFKKMDEKILISSKIRNIFYIKKEIEKLNAIYFLELKTNLICIVLTPHKTNKRQVKSEKDWLQITNPLSMINCYLS